MAAVFSIIIPVYKVEKYIAQCVNSIIAQTFTDFEVFLVDDCGGDGSYEIIRSLISGDNRFNLIKHETNKGVSAARNTGLDLATGKYIVFVDSDDWLEPNCLEVLYHSFNKYNTNSIWFDAYKYDDEKQLRLKDLVSANKGGFLKITPYNLANFTDYPWIKSYTRESIETYKFRFPVGLTFEDGEFYFEYFSINTDAYIIEDVLYNYRIREGSIVTSARAGNLQIDNIYQVMKNIRSFFIKHNIYEKYKPALLKLLNDRIRTCKSILNHYEISLHKSMDIINQFNFPNEFDESIEKLSPVFSVVVPVYNVEKYIEQCLSSILSQSFTDFELICIDDCGSDDSMKIVEKFAANDSRIRIIHHDRNKGLGAARNTGLSAAKGRYMFFVDSDDWLDTKSLEIVYNKFNETRCNTIWYKMNIYWEDTGKYTDMFLFPNYAKYPEGYIDFNSDNLIDFPLYTHNKAYLRKFLVDNNLSWTEGVYFEDVEFYFKTFIASPSTYIIDKQLYYYRRRNDSIIGNATKNFKMVEDLYVVATNVFNWLNDNNLFLSYKTAYLHYAFDSLNMFRSYPEIHKQLYPRMIKFLNDISFEENFKS